MFAGGKTAGATTLHLPLGAPFSRREVSLKGYDGLTTTWAISFEELQRYLKGRAA